MSKRNFHLEIPFSGMEHTGFEPVAYTLRTYRAPSCANAPCRYCITFFCKMKYYFITPHAIFFPLSPDGCVLKSSGLS